MADPRAARRRAEPREFTLKMWQNGFSIDDGELRDYNDPRNRAFLASVMSGRIPEELVREARDAIQLCREISQVMFEKLFKSSLLNYPTEVTRGVNFDKHLTISLNNQPGAARCT